MKMWQQAAQSVIVPPRGLRETAVKTQTAVNHAAHHRDQGEEGERRGRGRQGGKER
ncbi:hypothetical protein NQZ68_030669, partial [Dissostichus eleginoides]